MTIYLQAILASKKHKNLLYKNIIGQYSAMTLTIMIKDVMYA